MNEKLVGRFQFHNPWWSNGKVSSRLALPYKRIAFNQILAWLKKLERIVILKGPRRTGKTTIFYQLIDNLLQKQVQPEDILFLPFDDPSLRLPLRESLEVYQQAMGRDLANEPQTFIFLDEVQFLPQWEFEVKQIFDKKLPVTFFVSGSASSLTRKSSESLAGRTIEKVLLPFSFQEFVEKECGAALVRAKWLVKNRQQLALAWQRYVKASGFPQIMDLTKEEKQEVLKTDIIDKVIYKDLTQLYNIRDPLSLEKLFRFIIENTSGILNVSQLAGFLGLNRETVQNYLFYLQQAYLIFNLPKYSRSSKEIVRSLEKAHMIDQGFSLIYPGAAKEAVLESLVARHLWQKYQRHCYYWRYKYEVDVVFEEKGRLNAVEVKSGEAVAENALRGLVNFCKRYHLKQGKVVYSGEKKTKAIQGIKVRFVPFYDFCL